MNIFKSRKFWLAMLDVVISTAVYFVGKYVPTGNSEDIIWLIASWQPVMVALITGIAIEDAAEKTAAGAVTAAETTAATK